MLNPDQILARLRLLASTPWPLSMDTEGEEWMTCIGFSWFSCQCDPHTPREPFKPCPACGVVPFPCNALVIDTLGLKDKPYAGATIDAIRSILEGPMLKVVWAAGHEREFLAWGPKITLRNYEDAMFRWAERWPELRKSLKYAASILTRIPCWTEGIHWDEDDDKPAAAGPLLWRYNGLDCIATLRLWAHPQLQGLTPRQLERVKMHEQILEATTWASLKGIAYHADRARELREQLEPQVWEAQAAVDAIAGVELPPDERGLLPLVADTLCNKVQMRKALKGYKSKEPALNDDGTPKLRNGKPVNKSVDVPPRNLTWSLCREHHLKDTLPAINRIRELCSVLPMSPAARAECAALLELGTNVKSSPAILALLDRLGLPPVFKRGKRKLDPDNPDAEPTRTQSKDSDALLALFIKTGHPITTAILRVMSLRGRLQELGRKVGSDGRIRCSYLPGYGAETGRTTSYKFLDGSGGNLQTIPKEPLAGCWFND